MKYKVHVCSCRFLQNLWSLEGLCWIFLIFLLFFTYGNILTFFQHKVSHIPYNLTPKFFLLLLTILMYKNCTDLHCFQVILKHFLSLPDQREHFLIHHLLGSGWCTHPIINQGFLERERNTIKQMKMITSIFINENRTKADNIAM